MVAEARDDEAAAQAPAHSDEAVSQAPAHLDFDEHGMSGLKHSRGYITEELHPKLRGRRAMMVYREMTDNCPVTGAALFAMKTWASAANWLVEPAKENDSTSDECAWFVESCMMDMSHTWGDFIWESLSKIEYGWSLFEICFKRRLGRTGVSITDSAHDDGYIGWRKFAFRAQDTLDYWEFDRYQRLRGMWQRPPLGSPMESFAARNGRCYLPIEKCLLFRTQIVNSNPEGRSTLRNAVIPYFAKRRIQDIELIAIEREAAGMPDMQVPERLFSEKATPEQKKALARYKDMVRRVKRDELDGVVRPSERTPDDKPSGYKLSLMTSGGERAIDIDRTVRRHEARIAMSMLAEFIMVGVEKGGGLGGGMQDSKTDAFALSLGSYVKRVADVLQSHAVAPLCRINGFPEWAIPKIKVGDVAAPSLERMAAYVQALSNAGMLMWDPRTERKLRELGDLPQREETEAGGGAIDRMSRRQAQTTAAEARASGIPAMPDPAAGQ